MASEDITSNAENSLERDSPDISALESTRGFPTGSGLVCNLLCFLAIDKIQLSNGCPCFGLSHITLGNLRKEVSPVKPMSGNRFILCRQIDE